MSSDLWFVELSGNPTAEGGSKAAAQAEKKAFRDAAKAAGVSYKERFAFDDLWNGLSVQTGSSNLEKLSELKGVKAVYPVETIPLPETTQFSEPELATALAMTGADVAQSELDLDGTGVKVAVMDTGIDLDHPDLGGDGTQGAPHPNSRVVAQWDFVGNAFNATQSDPAYSPTPVPDPIADDCNSHGTHVSGIVGANGAVDGVAPGVSFGAYRVFGCAGATTADIMIAAMERADADGMDVLNMSIGSAFNTWAQYPTAAASDALVNQGVVVVASIGNSGADGVYSAGAPGVGNRVIGVASFDNTHVNLNSFTISPDDTRIGYGNAAAAPPAPLSGSLPMTPAVAGSPPSGAPIEGCGPVPAGTYAGKAVLVRRGTCTFHVKALNAQNGGAAAVVLFNNCPPNCGRVSPTVAGTPSITIPVVAISDTEGALINSRLTSGPVTMTWTDQAFTSPNPTGGTISGFSSFGLGAELALKPDIGAPGGLIRSTFPIELGSYATISGTSMASPHVAGAVALLLEANPNVGTKRVRDILQNSADPKVKFNTTDLDATHRQGAGMLDIDDAILATTRIEPGKLSLGEGSGGTETLTVTNSGGSAVTYDLSHQPALGTTNTFAPVNHSTAFSTVGFGSPNVTVPAGGSASVNVTITPNASLPEKSVYGGYITFTPQGGGQVFRVPYAGFKGDYQSIQILTPSPSASFNPPNQLPWLARLTACNSPGILRGSECFGGGTVTRQNAGAVFTFQPGLNQTPFVVAHFDHQVRSFEANLYSASNNKKVGEAFDLDYLGRNSTAGGIFAFIWGGQVSKKNGKNPENAVDGSYYLQVTATKALGDPSNAETWTSPTFVIDRP